MRISKEVYEIIERAAAIKGLTVNSFLVAAAFDSAKETIDWFRREDISSSLGAAILESLDNPRKPNKKLINAVNKFREEIGYFGIEPKKRGELK